MTNQNPAVPAPGSPQERRQRDLLSKVNAHADRSLDRLFADIEELLSGDLEADSSSAIERAQHKNTDSTRHYPPAQSPQSDSHYYPAAGSFTGAEPSFSDDSIDDAPPTTVPKRKKSLPIWLMVGSGLGITAIAAGSLLFWLVKERKIDMPNIDTSWLPFQSQQVSPADAQFADYMRKSIAKIEATNRVPVAPAPAANIPEPALTTPAAANPTITNAPSAIVTAPISASPAAVTTPIALVKTLDKTNRPGAIFQIDGQTQTIRVGQQIGTSKWSLVAVAKGEVTIKQKGGQIRSLDVGQKF
ncbi:alpha-ketoglutarate decarboxylase [Chamaesiphon minutus]|uniref:Type IV pilus biogenesis n=1 Tax=Chamaesiphon minutus (strain ATCC 27169 / PCC 6605) TaxID=1173020 RepID=K9UAH5_CHAP6|nr:alpha-ketoglutarate decarboxylase [Chamaesiphon minutus]AFY91815.1 hypothetical protein Cha6605_0530 [Chamaesiphon minutus PCC 6605]